jgi:hypothetical protein
MAVASVDRRAVNAAGPRYFEGWRRGPGCVLPEGTAMTDTSLTGAALATIRAALRELNAGRVDEAKQCLRDLNDEELAAADALLSELAVRINDVAMRRQPRRVADDEALPRAVAQVMRPESGGGWISGSARDAG